MCYEEVNQESGGHSCHFWKMQDEEKDESKEAQYEAVAKSVKETKGLYRRLKICQNEHFAVASKIKLLCSFFPGE